MDTQFAKEIIDWLDEYQATFTEMSDQIWQTPELAYQEFKSSRLQADYLAGVWAYHAHRNYDILEEGDMQEAIQAANQIGDDTLGHIPERYTHGTSAQRVRWFRRGMSTGDLAACERLFVLDYDEL